MSRADDIRAKAEAEAKVAELEDELIAAKEDDTVTAEHKHELRYARWVVRGGPAQEEAALEEAAAERQVLEDAGLEPGEEPAGGHTSRATREMYARWQREQEGN